MQHDAREVNLFNTHLHMYACHLQFALKNVCLTNLSNINTSSMLFM